MAQTALSSLHEPWQRREWLRHAATVWGRRDMLRRWTPWRKSPPSRCSRGCLSSGWGTAEQYSYSPEDISHATSRTAPAAGWRSWATNRAWRCGRPSVDIFLRRFTQFAADCLLTALYSGNRLSTGPLIAAGTSDGQVFVWDPNSRSSTHPHPDRWVRHHGCGHRPLREAPMVAVCGGGEVAPTTCPGTGWHPWMCSQAGCVAWRQMTAWTTCESRSSTSRGYDCIAVASCHSRRDTGRHSWCGRWGTSRVERGWQPPPHLPGGSQPVTLLQVLEGAGGPFVVTSAEDGARLGCPGRLTRAFGRRRNLLDRRPVPRR